MIKAAVTDFTLLVPSSPHPHPQHFCSTENHLFKTFLLPAGCPGPHTEVTFFDKNPCPEASPLTISLAR